MTEIFTRPYTPPSPEDVLAWRQSSQSTSCQREPILDTLAEWFVAAAPATAVTDETAFEELKQRLEITGLNWARMATEVAVVRTSDDVARITTVDQRVYSSCGMAARPIESADGRDAVMLAVILIEPR